MKTSIKKNLIIRGIELKQMEIDGGCQSSYLGNDLKVFGGIQGCLLYTSDAADE